MHFRGEVIKDGRNSLMNLLRCNHMVIIENEIHVDTQALCVVDNDRQRVRYRKASLPPAKQPVFLFCFVIGAGEGSQDITEEEIPLVIMFIKRIPGIM
ncbi:MAG: hypothetical protein A4E65_00742 [Syntrophorhabdus sp. PtaU1.Bin153]|nr:MAG: hypothetical protein A4E65_00742 [Syntrophorhabdus sp. PtaU1.Bin153]